MIQQGQISSCGVLSWHHVSCHIRIYGMVWCALARNDGTIENVLVLGGTIPIIFGGVQVSEASGRRTRRQIERKKERRKEGKKSVEYDTECLSEYGRECTVCHVPYR